MITNGSQAYYKGSVHLYLETMIHWLSMALGYSEQLLDSRKHDLKHAPAVYDVKLSETIICEQ